MPELPDVEVFRRYVDATSLHNRVEAVHVPTPELLDGVTRQKLAANLDGARFERTRRRGKQMGVETDRGGCLLLHFGMTGFVRAWEGDDDPPAHTALLIEFAKRRRLAYVNKRKLGRVGWTDDFDGWVEDHDLGPDALDVDLRAFGGMLEGRRGSIKALLMNQSAMAGVGNVYSDEALFQGGVAPERDASSLSADERSTLHRALMRVLKAAIEKKADPEAMPGSWLLPHRERGARCPRCGETIEQVVVSGRGAYWCPGHQT